MAILLTLSLGIGCAFLWFRVRKIGTRERGLPPGPPTLPLIGNLHLFPTEFVHYKWVHNISDHPLFPLINFQIHRMGAEIWRDLLGECPDSPHGRRPIRA